MSERTFRGAIATRRRARRVLRPRLGRVSARRAPVDEVVRVLELFDTRYWDFTAKHFEKLVAEHDCERSYNWVRPLQARGRMRAAPRRGAHRRKRPRRALPGMMLPRTARTTRGCGPPVGPDRDHGRRHQRDLLGLLRRRGGYDVEFPGAVRGDPGARAVLLALRRPGATTGTRPRPAARWTDKPTQVGRALQQLDIELIAAYSPRPGGAPSACSGPCRNACPRNSGCRHHRDGRAANRFLREVYLPLHNARFATPAEDKGSAFVPFAGALDDILCVQQERTVGNDNTVRYHGLSLQIPPPAIATTTSRQGSGCTSIQTEPSPSSTAPDAWPATTPTASPSTAKPGRPRDPLRRSPPVPCGQVDSRSAPDHFPTGEAVNSFGT